MKFLFVSMALLGLAAAAHADALDEVNAERASYGLPPYQRDDALTAAAESAASYRAANLIEGHTANDFAALPPGCRADAAGCAAWLSPGWGACETYGAFLRAGAAKVRGRDGRNYMHLFVRDHVPGRGFEGDAASNAAGHTRVRAVGPVTAQVAAGPPVKPPAEKPKVVAPTPKSPPTVGAAVVVHAVMFPRLHAAGFRLLHPLGGRLLHPLGGRLRGCR